MSGHRPFRELARPIMEDPVRRERVLGLGRVYDLLLAAGEDDRMSDEELEEMAEGLTDPGNPEAIRRAREILRRYVPEGVSLVEELSADRRAEAELEAKNEREE